MTSRYEVIGESNGHKWIRPKWMGGKVACLDCGILRRPNDDNKTCTGKVELTLRNGEEQLHQG